MRLEQLRLHNFGCYADFSIDSLDRLAVLIGENDVGKSVCLEAVHVLCEPTRFNRELYARKLSEGEYAEDAEIEGTFLIEKEDEVSSELTLEKRLRVRHRFLPSGTVSEVYCESFEDERVLQFGKLKAESQRELLEQLGVAAPGKNLKEREEQLLECKASGGVPKREKWMQPDRGTLRDMLPVVERISAADFDNPDDVVKTALRRTVRSAFYQRDDQNGEISEVEELQPLKTLVGSALRAEVSNIQNILRQHHSDLIEVDVDPHLDFSGALRDAHLTIDLGDGKRRLRSFGDGTKRRLWMGLLEWEGATAAKDRTRSTLRLYDEPDVNLHYEAQRRLLSNITEISEGDGPRVQCIVCTHSVTFIDSVPPKNVVLLKLDSVGNRSPVQLKGEEAEDFSRFYASIGAAVGLTNIALLYERGFLVAEGETEFRAIPILYQKMYESQLHADRIKVINLGGSGAWRAVFRMLLANRRDLVHLVLDADCKDPCSNARINASTFEELGIDETFVCRHITFVGDREFEDAFTNFVIVRALNAEYPRTDGLTWSENHIEELRSANKFSKALEKEVRKQTVDSRRSRASKPDIGEAIARQCMMEEIPKAIRTALERIRQQAGVAQTAKS